MKNLFLKITVFLLMSVVPGSLFGMEVPANKKPEKTVYKGIVKVNDSGKMCLASKYYHMQKFNISEGKVDVSIPIVPVYIEIYQEKSNNYELLSENYKGIDNNILKANIPHFLLLSTLQSNNEFVKEGVIIKQEYPSFTLELMCMDFNKDYSVGRQLSEKFKAFEKQPELANFMWTRDIKFPDKSLDQKSELIKAGVIAEETQNGKTVLVHGEKRYRNQLVKNENQVKEDTASLSEIPIKKTEEKNKKQVIEGTARLSKIIKTGDGKFHVEIIPVCDGLSGSEFLPVDTSSDLNELSWQGLLGSKPITITRNNIVYTLTKDDAFNNKLIDELASLNMQDVLNDDKNDNEEITEENVDQNQDGTNPEVIGEGINQEKNEKLASSELREANPTNIVGTFGIAPGTEILCEDPSNGLTNLYINVVTNDSNHSFQLHIGTINENNKIEARTDDIVHSNGKQYKKDENFQSKLEELSDNLIKYRENISDKNSSILSGSSSTNTVGTISIPKHVEIICEIWDNRPSTFYTWVTTKDPDSKFRILDVGRIDENNNIEVYLQNDEIVCIGDKQYKKDENFQSKLEELVDNFRKKREETSQKFPSNFDDLSEQPEEQIEQPKEQIEQPEEQKNGSFAWLKKHPILSFGIGAAATGFMYLLYSKSPQYGHGFVKYVSSIVARVPGYNFVTGMMG